MAQERIIQNPVPSFRVSYGTWPGPEPIWGDIHVGLGNGNSPQQREKFNDLAAQHGGTVRNVGDKLWADFYHESEAQKFVRDAKVSLQMAQPNKEFELSPIMRQYADFKKTMPNLVPLFHVSGGYETYQGDAERVSKVLDIPVQESQTHLGPDGRPAKYVSFPEKGSVSRQETPLAKILAKGFPIAILEDMNKGKENNDTRNDERSNNEDRDLGRDEERDQSRGFHR